MNELAKHVWRYQDRGSVVGLAKFYGVMPKEVRAAYDEAFEANKQAIKNGEPIPYERRYEWAPETAKKVWEMHCAGMSAAQIGKEIGLHRITVANKIKKMKGKLSGCSMAYRAWTPEEDAKLLEMRSQGITYSAMADALGRTKGSVNARVSKLAAKGVY